MKHSVHFISIIKANRILSSKRNATCMFMMTSMIFSFFFGAQQCTYSLQALIRNPKFNLAAKMILEILNTSYDCTNPFAMALFNLLCLPSFLNTPLPPFKFHNTISLTNSYVSCKPFQEQCEMYTKAQTFNLFQNMYTSKRFNLA